MIKGIKNVIALFAIIVISINGFSQGSLTSSVPDLEFRTTGGEKIITVSGVDGQVTQGRIMKGTTVAPGFTVTVGVKQVDRVPVSIILGRTNIAAIGYKLELMVGKTWKPVTVDISVTRSLQQEQPVALIDPVGDLEKKKLNDRTGLRLLADSEKSPFFISRQLLIKNKISESLKDIKIATEINPPVIKDWFPKDTGAIGGTFILTGKNMDSILHLSLGSETLPVIKRIKNNFFEAVIVQLPTQSRAGNITMTVPAFIGGKRTTIPIGIDDNFRLVDQFSSQWPAIKATVINITPTPDFADRPHALKQYNYTILYEYVPGNVVKDFEWKSNSGLIGTVSDRSFFKPATGFGMGIAGEYSTGSGSQDASGGHFISGNMFVGTITGTIHSVLNTNTATGAEIAVAQARINTQINSYLNSNSQAQDIRRSVATAEFNYNTPRKFTITNTYAIRDVFDFNKIYSHGTTQGVSTGQSDVNVGMLNLDGQLAFRIASGPLGTEAVWLSLPFMMSDGWRITKFNWNEKLVFPGTNGKAHAVNFNTLTLSQALFANFLKDIEGCRNYDGVYRSIANNPRYDYHSKMVSDEFRFFFHPDFADESLTCNPFMRANPDHRSGHLDRQNVKGAFVNLKADITGTNDHRVTMILQSIELLGPRGGSASTAFDGMVRYEPLLSPSAGHVVGIVYPEFFRLTGDR